MISTPYFFTDDGAIPNNSLPVLIYSQVIDAVAHDPASFLENRFASHGWSRFWRDGIYAYHHYHSTSHEVLGCYCGQANVLFGGEQGQLISLFAGDVVLIPAGVGHFNKGSSEDFGVVGGYPRRCFCDMQYGRPGERPRVLENIASLSVPTEDPVLGTKGGIKDHWF